MPLDVVSHAIPSGMALFREEGPVGSVVVQRLGAGHPHEGGRSWFGTSRNAGVPARRARFCLEPGVRPASHKSCFGSSIRRFCGASRDGQRSRICGCTPFEGQSPREHRAVAQLQRCAIATDLSMDQNLEVERASQARRDCPFRLSERAETAKTALEQRRGGTNHGGPSLAINAPKRQAAPVFRPGPTCRRDGRRRLTCFSCR